MRPTGQHPSDFAALWVSVQTSVSAYVRSAIRDAHDQEDVLQNVARVAFERIETYDPARPFLPWVLGIARNHILSYYRSCKNDKLVFGEAALACIEQAHESLAPDDSARRETLARCITKLQERARRCLDMRYAQGRGVQEIASQMGTTPNAISMILFRSRVSLKRCVEAALAKRKDL